MTQQRCNSYYTATLNQDTDYPTLQGQHRVDVVIIGGGFTGVATAVELAEKGLKVAIVESHKIGWGATGRNGGQVTGSLSGDEAMRKQMRAPSAMKSTISSGTCAGAGTRSSSNASRNTALPATSSTAICTPHTSPATWTACARITTKPCAEA
jgi:monoamine oxidase